MKYSRKVRRCAQAMINAAALVEQSEVNEIISEKNANIDRLHKQLAKAIEEADAKANENIELTKTLGQVRCELRDKSNNLETCESEFKKLSKSNAAFSKEYNRMQDDNIALKQENLELQKVIIDKDYKLHEKDKLIEEKDDLIQQLKRPWYRKLFG